ncbi:hypothetical protein BU24DRAFT_488470 [Aaosphaeria arxii CBS 175.79]|uniref:Uncharacterized protein n=1 Tax=Aaosphaeria arxii CBS 175.79 TaxID=1450172 RepID=A0A6A5YC03_9PLEO|nr:uncharacterized protein BU24DRAFT_488470 [Aaosphaeria arxii CBS 175.79]KAF2022210.1 hypothetical protein BU24DRAFT_488470 [Aaosphaeria arxii CBS 175.79]
MARNATSEKPYIPGRKDGDREVHLDRQGFLRDIKPAGLMRVVMAGSYSNSKEDVHKRRPIFSNPSDLYGYLFKIYKSLPAASADYLFPHARTLYENKLEENPPVDIIKITKKARYAMIKNMWPTDVHQRMTIAHRIYRPFAAYVDFDAIFNTPDTAPPEVLDLCRRWRNYIKHCCILGMEATIRIRLPPRVRDGGHGARSKDYTFSDYWRAITKQLDFVKPPQIEDLPVLMDREEVGALVSEDADRVPKFDDDE